MPVGIQRLNQKIHHPNDRIIFIKSLPGPDSAVATDFLNRIAAQCAPIMRNAHTSVMTLEEHEFNREFVGRNFNGGEVIQLVLKSRSGRWLPFKYVQMVMMHELAHNMQMNHSRAFWKVRNGYADEMRALWAKGYSGDGMWGRGQSLYSGQFTDDIALDSGEMPTNLCGGTYRSRRRKRKRGKGETQQLTYTERKQRRIEKKFGKNGQSLGEDEDARMYIEPGGHLKGKPRVAKSKRGRELRAAAALARFDTNNAAQNTEKTEQDSEESTTESDDGLDGETQIKDEKGDKLVKVCGDEDPENDEDAKQELEELHNIGSNTRSVVPKTSTVPLKFEKEEAQPSRKTISVTTASNRPTLPPKEETGTQGSQIESLVIDAQLDRRKDSNKDFACPICSLANTPEALTCAACSHVLDTTRLIRYWKCTSISCEESMYLNSADTGVCGICGTTKSRVA